MSYFVRYNDDDWSILYKDGNLAIAGDAYHIDRYLEDFFEVDVQDDNIDFLVRNDSAAGGGTRNYDNIAQTTAEIDAFVAQ